MGELGGFAAQLTHFSGFIPSSRCREGGMGGWVKGGI
jgi:hypothetical protein